MTKQNTMSDLEIISMIDQNNVEGWKNLYDKYAMNMYVAVLWIVDDEIFAENILNQLFSGLKTNKDLLSTKRTLCASLLQYTYTTTYKLFKTNNWVPQKERKQNEMFALFNDLIYKPYTQLNITKMHTPSKERGIERLYSELNQMGNQQKIKSHKRIFKANVRETSKVSLT